MNTWIYSREKQDKIEEKKECMYVCLSISIFGSISRVVVFFSCINLILLLIGRILISFFVFFKAPKNKIMAMIFRDSIHVFYSAFFSFIVFSFCSLLLVVPCLFSLMLKIPENPQENIFFFS